MMIIIIDNIYTAPTKIISFDLRNHPGKEVLLIKQENQSAWLNHDSTIKLKDLEPYQSNYQGDNL